MQPILGAVPAASAPGWIQQAEKAALGGRGPTGPFWSKVSNGRRGPESPNVSAAQQSVSGQQLQGAAWLQVGHFYGTFIKLLTINVGSKLWTHCGCFIIWL
jgi:hypothetical protein